jgi:rare lipoprotein A (peptidoglycan hydrolase)
MFGFRFFRLLSMALCVCLLPWGYAPQAASPDALLVAAAQPQASKKHAAGGASKAQAGATAGKQAKGVQASAKRNKRAPLEPASAELPQSGIASWVGRYFQGRPVATPGERHVMESFTAAHRAIAFHTILKVTELRTGRSMLVRVNDRGPYIRGRIIDLAKAAAEYLGYADRGITRVRLELAGHDKDPAQRYYIRMQPAKGSGRVSLVQGFGPFTKFDEAASLFMRLYPSYPDAELLAVREEG